MCYVNLCYVIPYYNYFISTTENPVNPITRTPFSKTDITKITKAYKKKSEMIGREYVKKDTKDIIVRKEAQQMIDTGMNEDGEDRTRLIDILREMSESDFIDMEGPPPYDNHDILVWSILHRR